MKSTEERISLLAKRNAGFQPILFSCAKKQDKEGVSNLLDSGAVQFVVDDYEEQQRELFGINNPTLVYAPRFEEKFQEHYKALAQKMPLYENGKWIFYPWKATLVHILEHDDFYKVRTARNRNLITQKEQDIFYNAHIGIAGLSVGNSVALAIVLQGGGRRITLADMDALALSNTNRVRAGIDNLGVLKVEMTARQIYELNPYAEVKLFSAGLTSENIAEFFEGLDIAVDEIDNLAVKYLIRQEAKKHKIPLVMGADNGDNAVIDVERYDLDPNLPFFHGRLGDTTYEELTQLDKFGIGKTITKHIGPENVTIRMQESLLEMGKTIVSWPQLGGAALVNGASVAYCVRKILNGQPIEDNRALVSLDEKLVPEYFSDAEKKKREDAAAVFKKTFGL